MPQFILDHGTPAASCEFRALDAFTQGYIEAMFFTSTGMGEDEELEHATVADLHPDTLARIKADCVEFQAINADDLGEACDTGRILGYDMPAAGRDFWLTRNGHGVGFWDRGLCDIGEVLSRACGFRTAFPEAYLYLGDDDFLHLG